jgi:hypothetical protein
MSTELEEALKRLERAMANLKKATGGSTLRRVAKRTVRYALNPAEAVVDGIETVVDWALDD